ncbi:hypothetical protein M0D21_05220 [Aquimarina sp. D1M17]|uniref:hypothetical protein n=1 Tax=Aquimarina acroporae TaxID=2937283 RepID=UPI0020C0E7D7|nr:hypothetical protein [Aquimarina acroporae]MCK8520954.1 hypothetical protein [Aquimarina acroporae]
MKPVQLNVKYIEWFSPEELHEVCLQWISELEFIKIECTFLDELVKKYTLDLLSEEKFGKSKELVKNLDRIENIHKPLMEKIKAHHNDLMILIDGLDQLEREKRYKENHRILAIEINVYFDNYKEVKRKVFDLIKPLIKQNKQKRFLN